MDTSLGLDCLESCLCCDPASWGEITTSCLFAFLQPKGFFLFVDFCFCFSTLIILQGGKKTKFLKGSDATNLLRST